MEEMKLDGVGDELMMIDFGSCTGETVPCGGEEEEEEEDGEEGEEGEEGNTALI